MTVHIKPSTMNLNHVYTLSRTNGEIVFQGIDSFRQVFNLNEASKAASFDPNETYILRIIGVFENLIDARNFLYQTSAGLPLFNHEILMSRFENDGAFICNETGEKFHRQAHACERLGISQSNLSKHLRGDKNYKKVKGYTFSRLIRPKF